MDTSETYAKMRLEATPDLGMGIPIKCPCNLIVNDVWIDSKGDWYYATEYKHCQLERQDQLQEMLYPSRYKEKYDMCSAFAARCTFSVFNAFISDKPDVMSMEQLWLAFVMFELYHKKWVNGEWVDDTRNT